MKLAGTQAEKEVGPQRVKPLTQEKFDVVLY
jgi:hypothetical protein